MLTLHDYLPSQNAYKVRLLLNQLDIPYNTRIISIFEGEGQTDHYLQINPTGAVPAIELDDGRSIAESNAILMFLAEGTPYLPDDPYQRNRILQWLFFEGETVQSTVATLRHWVMTGKTRNRTAELLKEKQNGSLRTLKILDTELGTNQFLGGNRYTVADISVFAYVHRAEEAELPLNKYASLQRWINQVKAQPRFLDKVYPYSIDPYSSRELP